MAALRKVWEPNPGSQTLWLCCPIREALYEGTRGCGKTVALLADFAQHCGRGYAENWRGILFRKTYKQLDDVVSKSKQLFKMIFPAARWLSSGKDFKWVWPTGEELLFRQFAKIDDYWNYHGHEYPWIAWEELTNWAQLDGYEMMMSCNRSSIRGIPLKVRATTNPYGIGHAAVKNYFIKPAPRGKVIAEEREILQFVDGELRRVRALTKRVSIHGSYIENPRLLEADPMYLANIEGITDVNRRRAWLFGDWDIQAGGALADVWSKRAVVPRFRIPASWRVDRSFDWGSAHPFSVLWWAEADGTEATLPDGTKFCPPRRSLVLCHEWYGGGTGNQGLHMGARDVGKGIVSREEMLLAGKWIPKKPSAGPADNQISNVANPGTPTIADEMSAVGIHWEKSDKAPGTRKIGLQLVRDRLAESAKDRPENPALYVMDHCREAIDHWPALPRDEKDPEDVATDAEDHDYDALRYRVLKQNLTATVTQLRI